MPRVSPVPTAGGSRVSPRPSRDEPNVSEPECSRTSVLRLLPSESARAVPDGLRPWLGRPLPKRGAVGPLRQETRKWPKERERRGPRGCRDRDGAAGGAGKMADARRGELGRVGASGLAAAGAAFPCGDNPVSVFGALTALCQRLYVSETAPSPHREARPGLRGGRPAPRGARPRAGAWARAGWMRSGFGAALGDPVPDSSCPARGFCEDTWAGWARGFGSLGTFAKEIAGPVRERLASGRRKGLTKAVNRPCCRVAALCCPWVQPERSNAGAEVPHLRARSLEIRCFVLKE